MRLVLAIFAALLIIAAGCTTPNPPAGQQGTPSGGTPSGSEGGTPSTGGSSSGSGSSGGSSSGSEMSLDECLSACLTLGDAGMADLCRAGCHTDAAETTLDASKCDPIGRMQNMSIFYSSCLGSVAGKMKSIAPCDRLTNVSDRDWCIAISADENKDPSICQTMNSSMMKSICLDDTAPEEK